MLPLTDIEIRNALQPGDLGTLVPLHGKLYSQEYNYGLAFEAYVAQGLAKFYAAYDATKDGIWICEHAEKIVGSLVLAHTETGAAQLRYFLIHPQYRGIGLGKHLMHLYLQRLQQLSYTTSFLWTTNDLHGAAHLYRQHGFVLTEEKPSTAFGKPLLEQRYDLYL
jgi:N-acetylglutamate synthase-like GNAT family acetyltransferase